MSDALHRGAASLPQLLRALAEQSASDYSAAGPVDDDVDPVHYPALVDMVRASIESNLSHADPMHQAGYLQALTETLHCLTLGLVPNFESWDPISLMAPSYAAQSMARSLVPPGTRPAQ